VLLHNLLFAELELGKRLVIQTGIVIDLLARYRVNKIKLFGRYANRSSRLHIVRKRA